MSEIRESTLEGRAPKKLRKGVRVTPAALIPNCEMPWRKSLELISKVPERYLDISFFAPQMAVCTPPFPQSGSETTPGGHLGISNAEGSGPNLESTSASFCFSTTFSAHIVSHGLSMVANLLSMMETGVPERYPKLNRLF